LSLVNVILESLYVCVSLQFLTSLQDFLLSIVPSNAPDESITSNNDRVQPALNTKSTSRRKKQDRCDDAFSSVVRSIDVCREQHGNTCRVHCQTSANNSTRRSAELLLQLSRTRRRRVRSLCIDRIDRVVVFS
jgi:hypothetical protein